MGDSTSAGLKYAFGFARVLIGALTAAVPAAAGLERVVEDVPGRLVLEVTVPSFLVSPADDAGAQKVSCVGCQAATQPGAPDLPAYGFAVLSGPAA